MQNFNCIQFSLYAKFKLHDTCNIETISQYNGAMCLSQFCSNGGGGISGSAAQWWDRIAPKITIKYSKYGLLLSKTYLYLIVNAPNLIFLPQKVY